MRITLDGDVRISATHENKILETLDLILNTLNLILKKEIAMGQTLDQLTAQVQANTDVAKSAVVLINGIADRIAQAGVDPVKLQELTASLKSSDEELSAAVVANTPAEA